MPSAGAGFRYVSFLVRLWRDSADTSATLRISAESVQSGAVVELDDLPALLAHLQAAWAADGEEEQRNIGRIPPSHS